MDSLSVIVTAYNCAPYLRRTLQSVEEAVTFLRRGIGTSDRPRVEVVIVDDGSTDATPRLAAEFAGPRGPWELVRREKPSSPSCARNAGARHASGELLCFLDGDDLFLPEHLAACWHVLQDPAVEFVKTGVRLADPVHPDWRPRIEYCLVINLCVRRRCHEEMSGFPDDHLFVRQDDRFEHRSDVFYKFENMFYNQALEQLFRGRRVEQETVEYCRHPGNGYDRQYDKFRRPFAGHDPCLTPDGHFRMDLCEALTRQRVERVRQQRVLAAAGRPAAAGGALALAEHYRQAGDGGRAEAFGRQALRDDPSDAIAWLLLGNLCHESGRAGEASDAFRRAAQLKPNLADAHYGLGGVLAESGDRAGAADAFRQALRYAPDHAEALAGLGLALAEQGQLDEAVARLEAAVRLRPELVRAHYNLGVALAQRDQFDRAAAHFREAVRLKPDYAAAHYALGNVLNGRGERVEAIACYRTALQHNPGYAEAYNNLGLALAEARELEEAAVVLRQGVHLRPQSAEAHNNLGLALADLGRYAEAEACYHAALRLNPHYTEAHGNLGNAYKEQGRTKEALACYQVALWLKPDQPSTRWNRSLAWLQAGEFTKGWAEYEWRWKRPQARPRQFPKPAWDGTPLEGRTLLLHMEQGLGDMIQFVRYAPLVKRQGGRVVVECPGSLVPLFSTCPGIDALVAEGEPLPEFDCHVPLLSLPHRLGTTLETVPTDVPYLAAPEERVAFWRERLDAVSGFRVGVVWQGNPKHQWDRHRSAPLREFAPLARSEGVRLISLQKGPGVEQIRAAARDVPVMELSPERDAGGGFLDTAAVMRNLDLVVSADTAAAHLAGALGVPVWLALSRLCDWRWLLNREDSPWYPSMRLFRQEELGDWGPVFGRMAEALRGLSAGTGETPDFSGAG